MKVKPNLVLALLLAVPALSCTPTSRNVTAPESTSSTQSISYQSLVEHLRAAGLQVEPAGEVHQPFFTPVARVILVDGEDVQVYQYPSGQAAEAEASRVSATGTTIGTAKVSWLAPPHFFRKGAVLVIHLGSNPKTLDALERLMGPQFAGQ